MNTATATRKIKLNRVLNGWYCYNAPGFLHTFDIHKIGAGMWSVEHQDWTGDQPGSTKETWVAESLDAVRALIASTI